MFFSKSLLSACLVAGQWLFVLTGGLAFASLLSDWLRADANGKPGLMTGIGAVSAGPAQGPPPAMVEMVWACAQNAAQARAKMATILMIEL